MSESIKLLPSPTKEEVVLPRLASRGGSFKEERQTLVRLLGPYVNLDQQLYDFANKLLDERSTSQITGPMLSIFLLLLLFLFLAVSKRLL